MEGMGDNYNAGNFASLEQNIQLKIDYLSKVRCRNIVVSTSLFSLMFWRLSTQVQSWYFDLEIVSWPSLLYNIALSVAVSDDACLLYCVLGFLFIMVTFIFGVTTQEYWSTCFFAGLLCLFWLRVGQDKTICSPKR